MASFRDLLAQTKAQITEVDTAEADRRRLEPGTVLLDVREPDEYDQGALPGAVHIPRGHLESQVEARIIDHDALVDRVLRGWRPLGLRGPHAGGARVRRRRVHGRWVRPLEGRGPGVEEARQPHAGPAGPVPAPRAPPRGRRGGPGQAPGLEGADARRRRPRLPGRPLPGRGRRRHDRHRRHGRGRRLQPAAPDPPQPGPGRRSQGRLGQEDPDRDEPRRGRGHVRHPPVGRERDGAARPATTWSSTAPTTSPAGTC